jgi:Transposase IS66 family
MILRFATDLSVPFTNNEAERSCRPVKVQQRTSGGCWRTLQGLTDFAIVQSYLDTATKWGLDKLDALHRLFTTGAWLPQRSHQLNSYQPPALAARPGDLRPTLQHRTTAPWNRPRCASTRRQRSRPEGSDRTSRSPRRTPPRVRPRSLTAGPDASDLSPRRHPSPRPTPHAVASVRDIGESAARGPRTMRSREPDQERGPGPRPRILEEQRQNPVLAPSRSP